MRFTDQTHWQKTYEWGATSTLTPEQELIKMSLCSFVSDSFYESQENFMKRFRETVSRVDDGFALRLAVWARDNGLRTINQMILVEKLKSNLFARAFDKLVKRPDELLDIVGYYAMINWQHLEQLKLANKLKNSIREKLATFSEYSLAKYRGKWTKINLYDLVNITHPKSEAIDKMMKGKLQSAETWEKNVSAQGNNKEVWLQQLRNKTLGNLAFVRNIRNMLKTWVDENDMLKYASELQFHNVYPFQLINALAIAMDNWLQEWGWLFNVLESKIKESLQRFVPLLEGKSCIGIDVSGSMFWTWRDSLIRKALYYGLYLSEMTGTDVYFWSNTCQKIEDGVTYKEAYSIASRMASGTSLRSLLSVVEWKYDSYFVITDEQVRDASIQSVQGNKYIWNLSSYANSISTLYGWNYITGLDDRLLGLMQDLNNVADIQKTINSIEL